MRGRNQDLAAADEAAAYQFVLSSPHGRLLLWDLLADTTVFGASFVGEYPMTTAFNEGKRHVGLSLLQKILTERPDAFTIMRDEHSAREARYAIETEEDTAE